MSTLTQYNPMETFYIPDESHKDIDWDAPMIDPENRTPTEPGPPPNRSIYPLSHSYGWKVKINAPNPNWTEQFQTIKTQLHNILTASNPPTKYTTIEHIGSTSIPNLHAKPNIDIIITLPNLASLNSAISAFLWETPSTPPFIRYTLLPNGGGLLGRESLKLYTPPISPYYLTTPERSVYLINTDPTTNPHGMIHVRGYRSVKRVLTNPENKDLLDEYANTKLELAKQTFDDSITYAKSKNDVVRKILKRDGWTDEEVDVKEGLSLFDSRSDDDGDDGDDLPY